MSTSVCSPHDALPTLRVLSYTRFMAYLQPDTGPKDHSPVVEKPSDIVLPDVETSDGAFLFLVGTILNQNIAGQQAWTGVARLADRGVTSPDVVHVAERDVVLAAVQQAPMVHPFSQTMAEAIRAAATDVMNIYDGDARQLWQTAVTRHELLNRLVAFRQIGEHKADVAICLLAEVYSVVPRKYGSLDRISTLCPSVLDMLSNESWAIRRPEHAGTTRPDL